MSRKLNMIPGFQFEARTACGLFCLVLCIHLAAAAAGQDEPSSAAEATEEAPTESIRSAVVPDPSKPADPMDEAKAAAAPVPVPPLSHYAALWQRSMFTTHDLPAPELPQGPGFADQLVLAGIYEVDGAVVAVILDKLTAQISEARIGSDNEQGIRIKSVSADENPSATRVQLQKGMQSGWIQFAETHAEAAPAPAAAPPGMSAQPLVSPAAAAAMPAPQARAPAAVLAPLPAPAAPGPLVNPNPALDDIPLPPQ